MIHIDELQELVLTSVVPALVLQLVPLRIHIEHVATEQEFHSWSVYADIITVESIIRVHVHSYNKNLVQIQLPHHPTIQEHHIVRAPVHRWEYAVGVGVVPNDTYVVK